MPGDRLTPEDHLRRVSEVDLSAPTAGLPPIDVSDDQWILHLRALILNPSFVTALEHELVSVNDAADILGCTVGRVRQMLRQGELSGIKVNRRAWLVFRSAAETHRARPSAVGRPRVSGS